MASISEPLHIEDPALQKGSLILVTGVNGYIGSHIARQLLASGYNVRGVVRKLEKASFLFDLFAPYGKESFSLVEVADFTVEGIWDKVVKDTAGVVHVASPTDLNPDPHINIPIDTNGLLGLLNSSYKNPSVRRFVYTSSSFAAYSSLSANERPLTVTQDTWNEEAIKEAWTPPFTPERGLLVYSASKAESEKAMWKTSREKRTERPDLVVNSVLPCANYGTVLDVKHQGLPTSVGMLKLLYEGDLDTFIIFQPSQFYVDVEDDARIHVAALLMKDVADERLFAFAAPKTCNDELAALRKANPNKTFPKDVKKPQIHLAKVPNARAQELLQRMGREGWTSLEESIKNTVPALSSNAKINWM